MKNRVAVTLVLVHVLSACGVATVTQEVPIPSRTNPAATVTLPLPTSTIPATEPLPLLTSTIPTTEPVSIPTPTATPEDFGPSNYSQFVQVQAYSPTLEDVFGTMVLSMSVDDAAYSPDGRYVAIGGCTVSTSGNCQSKYFVSDSFLMILDSQTGEIIATLPETEVSISSLVFTADSEKLVYAVNPVRIVVWDIAAGEVERTLWKEDREYSYPQLAISPDDSMIAAVFADTLMVWESVGGELLTQKPAKHYGGYLPRFNADGSRLAVFTQDHGNEITVYDTRDWSKVSSFQPPGDQTSIALFSPDGDEMITVEESSSVDVLFWEVVTGDSAGSLGTSFEWVSTIAFSPDGSLLLVSGLLPQGDLYEVLHVWDFAARKPLGAIFGIMNPIGIQFSADGKSFLMNYSPFLYRWSLPEGDALAVRQAVLDFLGALSNGDYAAAAKLFQPTEDDIAYFASLGLESNDPQAVFEFICMQATNPCTTALKEILYEGKNDDGSYAFLLTFTAPDGSVFVDGGGDRAFWIYVASNASGGMTILSMPSFLYGS